MRRLFSIFKRPWFITLLGLVALGLLIWFLGPLFAFAGRVPLETPSVRAAVISTIVVLFMLNGLRKWFVARRKNAEMIEGMAETPVEDEAPSAAQLESAEEMSLLQGRFKDALATLKTARFGASHKRMNLYQLPWYMLIGPPGSGKTTVLVNSGLRFPLGDELGPDAIRGVGGTRNCDWWFTDQAVLLDTAGRYTTQDSQREVDSAAWEGFLGLLKKHRRRRPINGALVVVSLAEIMQGDETARRAHARAVRQRLRELHEILGVRFPVYMLFTKCDLVSGFMEFFEDLGREERAQVWGMTFPEDSIERREDVTAQFAEQFDALVARLNQRLIERMQAERDIERRGDLFVFPQSFAALGGAAERFLREVFEASRYEEMSMLRGVYFTSGTQEGNPVNRLMDSMAQHFGVRRQSVTHGLALHRPAGRSYFVTRLLQDVVFPESNLAGTNLRLERIMAWLQRCAYAAVVLAVIGAAAGWFWSYQRNQALVAQVSEQTETAVKQLAVLEDQAEDPVFSADALGTLHNLPTGPAEQARAEPVPVSMRLGLYQGEKLGTAANRGYTSVLRNQFLPRLMLQLEDRIKVELDSAQPNNELLYEVLKIYLMLDDPERFDVDAIREWTDFDWDLRYGRTRDDPARASLSAGRDALLDNWPTPLSVQSDAVIIEAARDVLARVAPAERVYARIRGDVVVQAAVPPLRITDVVRDVQRVFVRRSGASLDEPLPGMFTYAGHNDAFKPALDRVATAIDDEKWVLGERAQRLPEARDLKSLKAEVTRLYMKDYIRAWDGLLNDLALAPFSSVEQAAEMLATLSGRDSPLLKLMTIVEQETTLTRISTGDSIGERVVERGIRRSIERSRLGRLLGGEDITSSGAALVPQRKLTLVDEHYQKLNDYVRADSSGNAQFDRVMKEIGDLFEQVHSLDLEPDRERAIRAMTEGQGNNAIGRLDRIARRAPEPIDRFSLSLALNARSLAVTGLQASLNDLWEGRGRRVCEKGIEGRYPFDRNAVSDVRLEDFTRFFGPSGVVKTFFDEYLVTYIDTSVSPWSNRRERRGALRLSPEALAQFERAATIREAFFSTGRDAPLVNFELTPVSMDKTIKRFNLDLEGQAVSYRHGPVRPTPLAWPGPGAGQVRIDLQPPLPGGRSGFALGGPWAWFRLLDRFPLRRTADPDVFEVTFDVDGRQARYGLRAGSAFNPFVLPALAEFRCPGQL